MKRLLVVLLLVAGLAAPAVAAPVTVLHTGTTPAVDVISVYLPWIALYAIEPPIGVENLTVGGVDYQGFCIDLYHMEYGFGGVDYNIDELLASPTYPAPMGAAKADFIKEMWAHGFADALLSNEAAAGFQLAIWGVLQGSVTGGVATADWTWLVNPGDAGTYGATALISWTNTNNGALANVVGLNAVDEGPQSYAIEVTVPDGGATLTLLGGVLMGLGVLRRKFRG